MKFVLAADLGGTKARFAAVTEDYRILAVRTVRTVREQAAFVAAMEQGLDGVLADVAGLGRPAGIGLGTAGVVPTGGRSIARAPNPPLDGFPLADHLEERYQAPTTVLNDGRASALGEYARGDARGRDPLLCLYFGTGIGIGLVVDGRVYEGADNAAGEIGHTIHVPGGATCSCGAAGHFEAYCGGRPMTERAAAALGPPPSGEAWTAAELEAHDDSRAGVILQEACVAAGVMVANAVTLLNPRAIVLGGGVIEGWPGLRQFIESYVREHCGVSVTRQLEFHGSLDGSDAILWGAAAATGRF